MTKHTEIPPSDESAPIWSRPSFTINTWTKHRQLSRATFYNLESEGKAPRTYSVGNRRYISPQADEDWVRAREAEASAQEG